MYEQNVMLCVKAWGTRKINSHSLSSEAHFITSQSKSWFICMCLEMEGDDNNGWDD